MSDTLVNDWRQRMAGRSALCAVLLAVPVAVAAQISFSAGLDSVPFGVSTFAAGPDTSSIGRAGSVAPSQNLSTLLNDTSVAAGAAAGAATGGLSGSATTPGGTSDVSDGGIIVPGTGGGGNPGDTGGGGENPGGPSGAPPPTPTPPTPTPPATPEPPPATPVQPSVPGVTVPDAGGVINSVTDSVGQAPGLLPDGGG
jgi:hypothetical protein